MRITPACAGKSYASQKGNHGHKDHPRLCGEKLDQLIEKSQKIGSPPPVRGKAIYEVKNGLITRITPACAGKRRVENGVNYLD